VQLAISFAGGATVSASQMTGGSAAPSARAPAEVKTAIASTAVAAKVGHDRIIGFFENLGVLRPAIPRWSLFRLSIILSENRFPLFRIML
jgi:hypothetical protein